MNGEEIPADWCGGIEEGSVVLTEVNEQAAAAGTAEAIEEAKAKLVAGELHVFDTSTFTVDGETLTSHMADVDTDDDSTPDTEVISDGVLPRVRVPQRAVLRSAHRRHHAARRGVLIHAKRKPRPCGRGFPPFLLSPEGAAQRPARLCAAPFGGAPCRTPG